MRNLIKDTLYNYILETRKPRGFWDDEENLVKAALEYDSLTKFQQENQTAYVKALKKGKEFFDSITTHMVKPRSVNPYSDQELEDIAKKYKTKKDFQKHDNGAYQVALRRGKDFWNKITSHMEHLGSLRERMVYGYFFPQSNSIYVGLTWNIEKRNEQHLVVDENEKQTTVGKYINETGEQPRLLKFTNYISPEEAQKKEEYYSNKFRNDGMVVLNRVKTGGLGKGLKYTNEELRSLFAQINDYKDLYKKHSKIYKAAKRRGKEFLIDITNHMIKHQTSWSEKNVRDLAKQYNSKSEFQTAHPGATTFAKKHGFWEELFSKNVPTPEEIISLAKEFDTQDQFRRAHPSLFNHAKQMGLLQNIMFKKSKKRAPTLQAQQVIDISKKYTKLKDFYSNDMIAYRRAKTLCKTLGKEFCTQVFSHLQ